MSVKLISYLNDQLSRSIESKLMSLNFRLSDHDLSRKDSQRVGNAYFFLMNALFDTASAVAKLGMAKVAERTYSVRRVGFYIDTLVQSDVGVVISQQKAALQVIRHIPERGCHTVDAYKKLCIEYGYDRSLSVNEYINTLLRELCLHPNANLFSVVNTLVQLISRLTLRDIDWIEEENIQAYKDFEDFLFDQDVHRYIDSTRISLIADMHDIITDWFQDFSLEDCAGQHGYGATNQVRRSVGTEAKYAAMCFDYKTSYAAQMTGWRPIPSCWPGLGQSIESDHHYYPSLKRITRVQLVPKGIDKKRVVSMEDTTNQFFQKNIQLKFADHFRRHPDMRICLEDQSLNRELAREGSASRKYATIDLSSASDSVTWELVKDLFRDTPVYKALLATRTGICELPDGTRIHMRKAYPMGSALCFPIECVVFSSVIAAVNLQNGVYTNYRVYGDDMIVHKLIFNQVMSALKLLGFIVNDTKSFPPEAPFKESCGIECWDGVDVSPLRLSRKWDIVDILTKRRKFHSFRSTRHVSSSTQLCALYDIGNCAFDHGFLHVRKAAIRIANDNYSLVLYSHNHEYGFLSYGQNLCTSLDRVKKCHEYDPWRIYVKSYGVHSEVKCGSDDLRYSKLLETYWSTRRTSLSIPSDRIECKCGSARTYLKIVRVPLACIYAYDSDIARWNASPVSI